MAGRGPAPKPKGQRVNRVEPQRGEWVSLAALAAPVLPELDSVRSWHPRTEALWAAWRDDPATGMYGPAEVAAVVELAWLVEEFVSGNVWVDGEDKDAARERVTAGELRLRMDGLGLSAKGKRELRWIPPARDVAVPEQAEPAVVRNLRAV